MKLFESTNTNSTKPENAHIDIRYQPGKLKVLICLLLIANCQFSYAQLPISLRAAVDTALKNNLSVKNEKLRAQYQQLLVATSASIAPTNITAEAGQINSIYTDTKFGISQTFALPSVYKKQKELLVQEAKSSFMNIAVKESLLKRQVEQSFYHLLYLTSKQQLLQSLDTLYSSFLRTAELRLNKGETNLLEKAMAENQLGQVSIQLQQLMSDKETAQLQFQLLLNTPTVFTPVADQYKMKYDKLIDTSVIINHPYLKQIQQQQAVAKAAINVEQAKLLPEFLIGVNNTSIKGTGADDKVYSASHRFTAVQAGIAIPIFAKSQKAKVKAVKLSSSIAESNYSAGIQLLKTEYAAAVLQYKKYQQTVAYFENNTLNTAKLITTVANQQFANGSINYLEWVMLVNQSVTTQNDYIEAVKNLDDAIIQLHYFDNN